VHKIALFLQHMHFAAVKGIINDPGLGLPSSRHCHDCREQGENPAKPGIRPGKVAYIQGKATLDNRF
jgi:hypothetical protein